MKAALEPFRQAAGEASILFPDHFAEAGPSALPLDFDYPFYFALDDAGRLLFAVLRDGGRMVGYHAAILTPNPFSRRALTLYGDMVYVRPSHRGRLGWRRMWRVIAREAERRGAVLAVFDSGSGPHLGRMLELSGFEPAGAVYRKGL